MPGIAKFSLVALDAPDHAALAAFYAAVTGWTVGHIDEEWAQLTSDVGATIAVQYAPGHVPARKAEVQPGTGFRVYLDPAGHPFCLVLATRDDTPDA